MKGDKKPRFARLFVTPRLLVYTCHHHRRDFSNMASYEIEIKSLLGTKENVERLKAKLEAYPLPFSFVSENRQLNHYFTGGEAPRLMKTILPYLPTNTHEQFIKIIEEGKDHSVRTRQTDNKVIFVIKASLDDMTSSNGVSRMEFEAAVNLTLLDLDRLLLDAGYEYQAKWSRQREEYDIGDVRVCIDKNAGYGYVAEFEKVIPDASHAENTKNELRALMDEIGVKELSQDRLARMFAHYNKHWRDYYGTERVFVIE